MASVIELAPEWKRSLTLTSPLILASGALGDPAAGAIVSLPLTLYPRAGAPTPRVMNVPGGVMLRTGGANPGLDRFLRENRRSWENRGLPVIAALAAQGAGDWPAMAARLERVPGISGVELHLNPTIRAVEAIHATRAATELPILVKLDLDEVADIAADCVAAGGNCLVIARAPRGMMMVDGRAWYGRLYAPTVKPIILRAVAQIAEMRLPAPLVACGGVHSGQDVHDLLAAGASAVEIDSAHWVEPKALARIAAEVIELD
jgi:dihydroorotate dehydrogenase (NAD+) catalytic subunit